MQLFSVVLVFAVSAAISVIYLTTLSNAFWEKTEYIILVAAFVGIIATVAEIRSTRHEQAAAAALSEVEASKARLVYRTEWVMNACNVWWNDVLNQTNEPPVACEKEHPSYPGQTCEDSCRAAHLVGQHRMHSYSPDNEKSASTGLYMNICHAEATDIGMCDILDTYKAAAAHRAEINETRIIYDKLSSTQASFAIQLLFALMLGVQIGKVRRDLKPT